MRGGGMGGLLPQNDSTYSHKIHTIHTQSISVSLTTASFVSFDLSENFRRLES